MQKRFSKTPNSTRNASEVFKSLRNRLSHFSCSQFHTEGKLNSEGTSRHGSESSSTTSHNSQTTSNHHHHHHHQQQFAEQHHTNSAAATAALHEQNAGADAVVPSRTRNNQPSSSSNPTPPSPSPSSGDSDSPFYNTGAPFRGPSPSPPPPPPSQQQQQQPSSGQPSASLSSSHTHQQQLGKSPVMSTKNNNHILNLPNSGQMNKSKSSDDTVSSGARVAFTFLFHFCQRVPVQCVVV